MARPRIALLGRHTRSASALRHEGIVNARALLEAVWAAGGDPVTFLPVDDAEGLDWTERLAGVAGVVMPGGGDVDPARYTADAVHPEVYDVDRGQDSADLSLVNHALDRGLPLLAVCRGLHVLNVALGGTLEQHMAEPHRPRAHQVRFEQAAGEFGAAPGEVLDVSCFHHQRIAHLAPGLDVAARADDGTIEAVTVPGARAWTVGVQWHPEDLAPSSPAALAVVRELVRQAS